MTHDDRSSRALALLGGKPGPEFSGKPMPIAQQLKQEWELRRERHALVSKYHKTLCAPLLKLIEADKEALEAAKMLASLKPPQFPTRLEIAKPEVTSHIRSGSVLTILGAPYAESWQDGSQSHGGHSGVSEAFKDTGQFLVSASVDLDSASVFGAAGVAVWFRPIADNTRVRFAAYAPGTGDYHDNSWLAVAHNHAIMGVLVESWDLGGSDHQINTDWRQSLWDDGTGWYEEHSNSLEFMFPNDVEFFAVTSRWYKVWTWAWASCDANGAPGAPPFGVGSTASAHLNFQTLWCVFEQWT